jgi:hypothetical protein
MQPVFTIYPGITSRTVNISLTQDGFVIDHSSITRVKLYVGSALFDSQTQPSLFDLTKSDKIIAKLANASPALNPGTYTCLLVIYDSVNYAGGYPWDQDFLLHVNAVP